MASAFIRIPIYTIEINDSIYYKARLKLSVGNDWLLFTIKTKFFRNTSKLCIIVINIRILYICI